MRLEGVEGGENEEQLAGFTREDESASVNGSKELRHIRDFTCKHQAAFALVPRVLAAK